MSNIANSDYLALLSGITERIRSGQIAALNVVNLELIALYWDIGRMIVQRQQGDTWGDRLSKCLPKICKPSFLVFKDSPPQIYGACVNFTRLIMTIQNSHHW